MLQDGTVLGSYVIDGYVASGGMGVVYRAQHCVLRRTVAIKVLLDTYAANPKVRQRFEQEAMLQANLEHPNIVRVTDFVATNAHVALVMDFVAGPSLDQVLEEEQPGPWAEADWLPMFTRVVSAVAYAHAAGVVHRDIKPGNVLLDRANGRPGVPRIADFGIAKIVSGSTPAATRAGSRMGTVPYMAPEQFRGDLDVGPTADVYALGILAWRLAAGALPVNPDDMFTAVELYSGRRPVPSFSDVAPNLAAELARVLDSCLSLAPAARPADAGGLLRALGQRAPEARAAEVAPARVAEPARMAAPAVAPVVARLPPVQAPGSAAVVVAPAPYVPLKVPASHLWMWVIAGAFVISASVWALVTYGPTLGRSDQALVTYGPTVERSDCERAYDNIIHMMEADKTIAATEDFKRMKTEPEKAKALEECKSEKPEVINCFAAAKDMAGVMACAADQGAEAAAATAEAYKAAEEATRATGEAVKAAFQPSNAYVRIEPGKFSTPASQAARSYDEVQDSVTLTRAFLLKQTEVTQSEWGSLMGNAPSRFSCDDCPVEQVSWYDAVAYVNALSAKEGLPRCYTPLCFGTPGRETYTCISVTFTGLTCTGYRLPTEAEWEYAARAGTTGPTYATLDSIAWYGGNSGSVTHPVGQKTGNAFGLSDMIGNVWEWCHDGYGDYPSGAATDPTGKDGAGFRVFRGGSWNSSAPGARAGDRYGVEPAFRYGYLGFRPARSIP